MFPFAHYPSLNTSVCVENANIYVGPCLRAEPGPTAHESRGATDRTGEAAGAGAGQQARWGGVASEVASEHRHDVSAAIDM